MPVQADLALQLICSSNGSTKLNTAYIERISATFYSGLATLPRRSRAAQNIGGIANLT